jgi:hypothetical protein
MGKRYCPFGLLSKGSVSVKVFRRRARRQCGQFGTEGLLQIRGCSRFHDGFILGVKMGKGIASAVVCVIFSFSLFACGGGGGSPAPNTGTDSISITSVSPASAVAGASTIFTVDVSYTLASKDSGVLKIGFNTGLEHTGLDVDKFYLDPQELIVAKGSGTHTFTSTAVPVDWGSAGSFQAHVNLSENPHPDTWSPLTSDSSTISIDTGASPVGVVTANAIKSATTSIQCNKDICL